MTRRRKGPPEVGRPFLSVQCLETPRTGVPNTAEAVATVYGPVSTGPEWDRSLGSTLCAHRRVHLSYTTLAKATLLAPSGITATGASLRLVGITLRSEELLFTNGEGESRTTLDAGQALISCHLDDLPSLNVWLCSGHPAPRSQKTLVR